MTEQTSVPDGFTPQSGVFLRGDLSLAVHSGDTAIEVRLTPAQAIEMAMNLLQTAANFLTAQEAAKLCKAN